MWRLLLAVLSLAFLIPPHQAQAQSSGVVVQVCGTLPLAYRPGAQGVISLDVNGNTCIAGTFSATGGTISNGTDGQATTSTNQGAVAYNYGFNGATWDRLQVDASKFLKVNCAAGCTAGTASNATSGQATSATNGQSLSWLYGFNGATWDQLSSLTVGSKHALTTAIVDGSGNQITSFGVSGTVSNATSAVATSSTNIGAVSWLYGFNGTTWDQLQVDASKFLKVNCSAGCTSGSVSNATSAVATSSTNLGTVAYNYGFNGTTWDQLQVDASKNLKVLEANSASILAAVQASIPAGTNIIGKVGIDQTTPGTTNAVSIDQTTPGTTNKVAVSYGSTALVADPCQSVVKTNVAISQTANTKLISATSAKKNYICSITVIGADAENISIVEGTGSVCATSTAAVVGGTTAATGPNLAANGGFASGNGAATIAGGVGTNVDLCLFQSGSGRVAGVLQYVQQ